MPRYDDDDDDPYIGEYCRPLGMFPVETEDDYPRDILVEHLFLDFIPLSFVPLILPDGMVFGHTRERIWIQYYKWWDLAECKCGFAPWLGTHYYYKWDHDNDKIRLREYRKSIAYNKSPIRGGGKGGVTDICKTTVHLQTVQAVSHNARVEPAMYSTPCLNCTRDVEHETLIRRVFCDEICRNSYEEKLQAKIQRKVFHEPVQCTVCEKWFKPKRQVP